MNALELLAATLGVINVALVVRRNLWNYPFGLAMVAVYGFVFYDAKLYSDALLQVFFFAIQLYGWINWHRARDATYGVRVEVLQWSERATWVAFAAALSITLGFIMAQWTDAVAPVWDAAIAGLSVTAQILQSRRRIESWVFWIAIDIAAIPLFFIRGLHITALLYAIFLVFAVSGLVSWWRQRQAQNQEATVL